MSRIDVILDWISSTRTRHEKHVAKVEAQRADTEWALQYVAQLALTMEHAPTIDRHRCCVEITHVMESSGYWKTAGLEGTEPTA